MICFILYYINLIFYIILCNYENLIKIYNFILIKLNQILDLFFFVMMLHIEYLTCLY